MSHTIGQVKEDNQQSSSNSSQTIEDSSTSVDKSSEPVSLLSDADYEFLFNQLLEGIAHGWHDRRIAKFFNQLAERGKSSDWIAWLERLRIKVITLPVQSKRQLGTLMIRFGELTQSTPEVKEVGFAANRIGRELLFGSTEDVIWEYVGPDLIIDSLAISLEEDLAERLPADFKELGSAAIAQKERKISEIAARAKDSSKEEIASEESFAELSSLSQSDIADREFTGAKTNPERSDSLAENTKDTKDTNQESAVTDTISSSALEGSNDLIEDVVSDPFLEPTLPKESISSLDKPTTSSENNSDNNKAVDSETSSANKFQEPKADVQKFEPELNDAVASPEANLSSDNPEALSNLPESDISLKPTELTADPVAIDMQQVMNLIQQDSALAQEISAKLNISPSQGESLNSLATNSQSNKGISAIEPDNSSIELIEGWFNLGLKQVSGGEFDKAIASWEKALKINPNLSEAWHNRGSALGRLGEYARAVESFEKALTIDPENYQAWNDRAHALYQMQQWSAAAASWSNAVKLAPGNHLFWYNRGCALEQLESWVEAIDSYEKSLEIKPDFEPARLRYTNLVADSSHAN